MPYFFITMKNKNNITLSTKVVEDFIWMSLRYCIGRHTGAAANHANTIMQIMHNYSHCFTKERKQLIIDDIRKEINQVLAFQKNVCLDTHSEKDIFSFLFYSIEENEDTTNFIYTIDDTKMRLLREKRLVNSIKPWESFESLYLDLINWVKLANYLDEDTYYKVTTEYQGKTEEHICYAYPMKIGNSYTRVFSSVLEVNDKYIASEYITKVEPINKIN